MMLSKLSLNITNNEYQSDQIGLNSEMQKQFGTLYHEQNKSTLNIDKLEDCLLVPQHSALI